MNSAVLLALVLLSTFGLCSLALSGVVALFARAVAARPDATAIELLSLRLLPTAGSLLLVLGAVLPAFLAYEPQSEQEAAGPLLWALAAFAAACLGHGLWRGRQACGAARVLLDRCLSGERHAPGAEEAVHLVESGEPLVAVVGAWRPRVIAAQSVRAACSAEEFRAVLAHEAAHLSARDNLKLLSLLAAPDVLAWTPFAQALTSRWRVAAEHEADERAAGADPERRLTLAGALIKVARLQIRPGAARPALGMQVASEDVSARVRALLAPPARSGPPRVLLLLAGCALLVPLLAMPRYALLHELIEQLVGLGR